MPQNFEGIPYGHVIPDTTEAYMEIVAEKQGIKLNHGDFRLLNKLIFLSDDNTRPVSLTNIELALRMSGETERTMINRIAKLHRLGIINKSVGYIFVNGHPIAERKIWLNPDWLKPLTRAQIEEINELYTNRLSQYYDQNSCDKEAKIPE